MLYQLLACAEFANWRNAPHVVAIEYVTRVEAGECVTRARGGQRERSGDLQLRGRQGSGWMSSAASTKRTRNGRETDERGRPRHDPDTTTRAARTAHASEAPRAHERADSTYMSGCTRQQAIKLLHARHARHLRLSGLGEGGAGEGANGEADVEPTAYEEGLANEALEWEYGDG